MHPNSTTFTQEQETAYQPAANVLAITQPIKKKCDFKCPACGAAFGACFVCANGHRIVSRGKYRGRKLTEKQPLPGPLFKKGDLVWWKLGDGKEVMATVLSTPKRRSTGLIFGGGFAYNIETLVSLPNHPNYLGPHRTSEDRLELCAIKAAGN